MRAIILYDTRFGNTETIAKAIRDGMKEVGFSDVLAQSGGETTHYQLRDADVWIFGSPTHRGAASSKFKKLFKWMRKEMAPGKMGFAFETRLEESEGGAAAAIEEVMRECGVEIIEQPGSFEVISKTGPLAVGEEAKAVSMGRRIAGVLRTRS